MTVIRPAQWRRPAPEHKEASVQHKEPCAPAVAEIDRKLWRLMLEECRERTSSDWLSGMRVIGLRRAVVDVAAWGILLAGGCLALLYVLKRWG